MSWTAARLPQLGEIPGRFVSVRGARLHYLDSGGSGVSVVLLHGGNQNVRTWELVLPHILGPWRLIAVDHPGHGLSELADGRYSPGELVPYHRGFIEALGLDRPIVVGHSLGASTGIALAGTYPGLLRGLVVGDMSPAPGATMSPDRFRKMTAAYDPGVGDASWADDEEAFRVLAAANPHETEAEVRARMRQQLQINAAGRLERARSPVIAKAIFEEVTTSDLWPLLPRLDLPVRVVLAERSDVLGRADAERMVRELPRGELTVVPNAHHDMQLCQPRLWGEVIADFLRAVAV